MREIWSRIKLATPTFFKRIMAVGLTLAALGGSLLEPHLAERLPEFLKNWADNILTIGLVMTAIAKLAVKDPEKIEK